MIISLSYTDLFIAATPLLIVALLAWRMRLGFSGALLFAGLRTAVQLFLVGFVLDMIFNAGHWLWVMLITFVMIAVAGFEVRARQQNKLQGFWSYAVGTVAMFSTAFPVCVLTLLIIVQPDPWYLPQYMVPLTGMLLGNTMTSIAIGINQLTQNARKQAAVIEARLMLGQDMHQASADILRTSVHSAMIPIINAMAAAGIISLPGMMTGQVLAGASPVDAVKYQILIMFLIAGTTGFATVLALSMVKKRLFDSRHRLRLDRLQMHKSL